MQKRTSPQGTTEVITPTIVGPSMGNTLQYVGVGLFLLIAAAAMAFWITVRREPAPEPIMTSTQPLSSSPSIPSFVMKPIATPPAPSVVSIAERAEVLHEDIYFEVGRRGLTDEGKAVLQKQAEFMTANPDWGALIEGHTDRQGSDGYNQILGLKRAETVKQYLIGLGVSENAIKVVSLGKAGALCVDTSDQCRHMNRRVHLELRKVGTVHMTLPTPPVSRPVTGRIDEGTDVSEPVDTLPPDPEADATASSTANSTP